MNLIILIFIIGIICFSGWYVGMIFEEEQQMLKEYQRCVDDGVYSDFCRNYEKDLRTTQ